MRSYCLWELGRSLLKDKNEVVWIIRNPTFLPEEENGPEDWHTNPGITIEPDNVASTVSPQSSYRSHPHVDNKRFKKFNQIDVRKVINTSLDEDAK